MRLELHEDLLSSKLCLLVFMFVHDYHSAVTCVCACVYTYTWRPEVDFSVVTSWFREHTDSVDGLASRLQGCSCVWSSSPEIPGTVIGFRLVLEICPQVLTAVRHARSQRSHLPRPAPLESEEELPFFHSFSSAQDNLSDT